VRGSEFAAADWGSKAGVIDTLANRLVQEGIYSRKSLLFPSHLRESLEEKGFQLGFPMTRPQMLDQEEPGSPGYEWVSGLIKASDGEPAAVPSEEALPQLVYDQDSVIEERMRSQPGITSRAPSEGSGVGALEYRDDINSGLVTADGLADQLNLHGVMRKKFINSLLQADQANSQISVDIAEFSIADPENWWVARFMQEMTIGITFLPTVIAGSAETIGIDLENWAMNSRSPIPGEGNSPEEKEILSAVDGVWALKAMNSAKTSGFTGEQSIVPTSEGMKKLYLNAGMEVVKSISTSFDMVGKISRRTGIPFADVMQALRDAERVAGGDEEKLFEFIRGYVNSQWRVTAPEGQVLPPGMIGKSDTERRILAEMFEDGPDRFGSRMGIIAKGGMRGRTESEDLSIAKEVEMRLGRHNQANIMKMAVDGALGPVFQNNPDAALALYGEVMGVYKEGMYGSAFLKFLELQAEYMLTEMPVNAAQALAAIVDQTATGLSRGIYKGGVKPYETPSEWDKFVQAGRDNFRDHPGVTTLDLWGTSSIGGKVGKGLLRTPEAAMWAVFPSLNNLGREVGEAIARDRHLAMEIMQEKPGIAQRVADRVPEAPELPQMVGAAPQPLGVRALDAAMRAGALGTEAVVSAGKALGRGETYTGAYEAASGGLKRAGQVAAATVLPDSRVAERYAMDAHAELPRPTEMPTGAGHPEGFVDRTSKMGWKDVLAELDKLDTSIMPYGWSAELPALLRNRAEAFNTQKSIMSAVGPGRDPSGSPLLMADPKGRAHFYPKMGKKDTVVGDAAEVFRKSVHDGIVYEAHLRRKLAELNKALEERFDMVELEATTTEKSRVLHEESVAAARADGRRVVDTETGLPLVPEDPLDPLQAAKAKRSDVDVQDVITTPVLEQGSAIRRAGARRGQDNAPLANAVDALAVEVAAVESPRRIAGEGFIYGEPPRTDRPFGKEVGETPATPAEITLKEFNTAREAGGGNKFLVEEGLDSAVDVALATSEARIAAEKGFIDLGEAVNIPKNAGVLDIADLAAYRANLTPQMRAAELVARGIGDYGMFALLGSEYGAPLKEVQYLTWAARRNKAGRKGAVDHASDYNKALTDAATRDNLQPTQWLAKNAREQRAESMIEAGISEAAIYEQIGFSAAEASSLALAGDILHPKPVTVPKPPYSAGKVIAGTTPARARKKVSAANARNIRSTEAALAGRESQAPRFAPSFEADVRPMWHAVANVFLDRSGMDMLGGYKESPYGRKGLRHNLYAITEFMERPFAFIKAPVTLLEYAGNRLRRKYEGRVDGMSGLTNFFESMIWAFTGPSNKLGYTNFHEIASAGRTGGLLADRISPVLRHLAGEEIAFTNKDFQALVEALDAPYRDTGYAGQYASDGWQIVGASGKKFIFTDKYANRVVDASKRWEKDFIIEDANGNKTRLGDFADKYAVFEGKRITVDSLQEMVRSGEISLQRAQRGVSRFEYRHKEGMKWSDLTDQQKSIILITNRLTAPLDIAFFDSAIQLATSPHSMRLSLGSGDIAKLDPILHASQGNIIKMASNWMSDFYDPRGAFSLLVDTLHQMSKTGIDPSSLDGPHGTAAGMDVMLGRVGPGGGTKEISISTISRYPNYFTTKKLKERLEAWNIGPLTEVLDGIGVLPVTRKRLLELQPELGLSEIVALWRSPKAVDGRGVHFRDGLGGGKGPPAYAERYYNSRIWDKYLTYEEKLDWGLWDLREAASKASLDMGAALSHQKLIVGMRESGMLLTHSEWGSLKQDAAKDAVAVFGRDSEGAKLSAERMERLSEQYVIPGEGFGDIAGPKVWEDLKTEFVMHKAIHKHVFDQAKMFESMKSGLSKAHQNIKLGLVFDPIGGTLLRNYFSNRWMMGLMADIPWNQRYNKTANKMIEDFYERGVVDPLYMEIRQGGYGKATAAHTEFQTAEAFLKLDLEMSDMSAGLTDGLLGAGMSPDKLQRFGDMLWYGSGATRARRPKRKMLGEGISPEEVFLRQLRMHEQRTPLGDWTTRGGLEGTRKASTAERIKGKAAKAKRWMVEQYGVIDDTAKLSYILQLIKEKHYSVREAIKAADKAFMAYDDVAPMLNLLRNNAGGALLATPFAVFAAKAGVKSMTFPAEHPGRAFIASNLMQGYVHAVSALINYDKEEIMSLMLGEDKILLPAIGSQKTLRRRGKSKRTIDPGKMINERDLSLIESGPKATDLGLWKFWFRQIADGERGAKQVDSPIMKGLSMLSAATGGSAPALEAAANALQPERMKKIDRQLREESFRDPAGSTIESVGRHALKILDPVMPSAYRSGAKLLSALTGESVGGQRGKLIERASTFTGVKTTVVDKKKALFEAERQITVALDALLAEYRALKEDDRDWTREYGSGEPFPQKARLRELEWVHTNSKHIKRGMKAPNNAKMILSYREWLPKMYTLLEDVDGMALNTALSRMEKGTDREDLSKSERKALDTHEERESMQAALRGIGAIAQEIGIGGSKEAALPYLFEEAAGGPQ
tara:strand:- start:4350 stop:11837 length:7488 start_codon:yes stop_codon:yes gene_type:complete